MKERFHLTQNKSAFFLSEGPMINISLVNDVLDLIQGFLNLQLLLMRGFVYQKRELIDR